MSERESGGASRAKRPARAEASFGAFVRKPVARDERGMAGAESEAQQVHVESAETWPDDAIEVGAIVDAYGLKGWVKVAAHADAGHGGDALLGAKRWWLMKGRERKSVTVLQAKTHSDSIVAHLGSLADRDAALALRGWRVHVRRSDFPVLGDDEYYWVDLLGLDVVNEAGVTLGQVVDMIDNGAHSVLRIEYPATAKDGRAVKGERLIPFVGVYVKTVDRAAKQIVVDWEADY
ncbi:ribosome maturation factor RimM [Trinickia terrae]|uniref:Ribosome maturation factor RimM n=1 Tax=Trinickia terrae TaxID=2571161 RepID=A0A4U1HW03_9BURK|nr:ribosome maturation factor RimM [Trinickia terrae]TKC83944.1 ribosome maturation factor RimM [Trinickia terrae]